MARARSPWLLPLVLAAGCFSLSNPAPPPVQHYQLDYPPPAASADATGTALQLLPLRSAAAYESDDIAYRDGRYRLDSYHYRRWVVPPARMIGDLVERDFVTSRAFRAVLRGPSPLSADYVLGGVVEEIEERNADGCIAHLRIRFTLARQSGAIRAAPLFPRDYEADEPCAGDDVEDLVAAMSRALASISERLRNDVVAAVVQTQAAEGR